MVVVVVAGLVVVVAGVVVAAVAGLDVVVVVVVEVAGLEVVGAFGAMVGLWAAATEAVANIIANVFNRLIGLMVGRFC